MAQVEYTARFTTKEKFSGRIRIKLRAKTDGYDIHVSYNNGLLMFNRKEQACLKSYKDMLHINDIIKNGSSHKTESFGRVPVNQFVEIDWIIGEKIIVVMINGANRFIGDFFPYITDERYNREFHEMNPAPIGIHSANGSTVTVDSLQVTEI